MAIRFDQAGVVARPKDMPAPLVSLVEQLGMAAIEVLHAACQCRCLDADSEVVVRAEQAVRVALPTEAVHNGTKKLGQRLRSASSQKISLALVALVVT